MTDTYASYDHAEWLQSNGAAARRDQAKPMKDREGRIIGWHSLPETLTPFQQKAAHILGLTFGGIYNSPIDFTRALWTADYAILPMRHHRGMATIDHLSLARFVFLCHDARIRGEIASAPKGLRIGLWARDAHPSVGGGHPSLDEAIRAHRAYVPEGHPVHYDHARDNRDAIRAEWQARADAARAEREQRT